MLTVPDNILSIEDKQVRETAFLFWLSTLSDEQRQELDDSFREFCEAFAPFLESLRDTAEQLVSAICTWVEENPQVKEFVDNANRQPL